jgi:hypothetical protein
LDFFFVLLLLLLLLLSLDFSLDVLGFPSSVDLSVLFFDAAGSEPFFLDLLLSDFGDFFFSEALDFVFLILPPS